MGIYKQHSHKRGGEWKVGFTKNNKYCDVYSKCALLSSRPKVQINTIVNDKILELFVTNVMILPLDTNRTVFPHVSPCPDIVWGCLRLEDWIHLQVKRRVVIFQNQKQTFIEDYIPLSPKGWGLEKIKWINIIPALKELTIYWRKRARLEDDDIIQLRW